VSSYGTAIGSIPRRSTLREPLDGLCPEGRQFKADEALRKLLTLEPNNAEANFNMGLLKAEINDPSQAEKHLRRALKTDPQMSPAAYNLCVLLGEKRAGEALGSAPGDGAPAQRPPYAWTYAYYQNKKGDSKAAARTLEDLLNRQPAFADGYLMLADICFQKGDRKGAEQVLEKALDVPSLSRGIEPTYKVRCSYTAPEALCHQVQAG